MIMELDSIAYIEGRGSVILGGIKKENFDSDTFYKLVGDKITVESIDGSIIILDVKDLSSSKSLTGDYLIRINVRQIIKEEYIKKHCQVNRYGQSK